MAILPPKIQTYHCLCSSLLLASTHTLSALPTRSSSTGGLDSALILPLPLPHAPSDDTTPELPDTGYTVLVGLTADRKITLVRREDGFEKRLLHRCARCRLVVGYELPAAAAVQASSRDVDADAMEVDADAGRGGKGKGREEGYTGKVLYVLPAGIMSTDVMMAQTNVGGRRIGEDDVDIKRGALGVFE